MRFLSLYRVECRRLTLSKYTWVVAILSLCGPLLGHTLYIQSNPSTVAGQYIANPVLAGTVIGAILWAVLTFLEIDRVRRTRVDVLMDAIVSPVRMASVRVAALLTLSAAASLLCMLLYLPYTAIRMDYLFAMRLYLRSFCTLMLPTWWISILLAAALYQILRRIELAGLVYAGCVYCSMSRYAARDFFLRWINPLVSTVSDGFSSLFYLRIAAYTRLMWLALVGGLWAFSLLCIRRYEKNLVQSFARGVRRVAIPLCAIGLLAVGTFLWVGQPFVDHGPAEFSHLSYETPILGNLSSATYRIDTSPSTGRLHATAEYTAYNGGVGGTTIWLNPSYRIIQILCDGEPVAFQTTDEIQADARRTNFTLEKKGWQSLVVEYAGYPAMLRCYAPYSWGNEVTPEYVSLSNTSGMPWLTGFSMPRDYTLEITLPGSLMPILNHEILTEYVQNPDGSRRWTTRGKDSIWLTACDYRVDSFQAAGMDVDFIYSRRYASIMEAHNMQDALAEVLTYCTDTLGKLPWGGKSLMMVQRSTIMDGGNAGRGWVEWGESTFATGNLNDPQKGANAAEVFVHEMVHLWWGGLGVYCGGEWDRSGHPAWSDEGLTVYTTYRIMKDKYGEAYAKMHYVDAWQAAVDIQERGFYYRHPEYLDALPEQYRADLAARSRSTNLYSRMPLMILKAEQLVGGEAKMDEILRDVQRQYAGTGRTFTFENFLDACGLTEEVLTLDDDI